MSHPNPQRRSSRTFRVEALESRALLSTAGVVSRPATAAAPGVRIAQVSSSAGDPEYGGVVTGTGGLPEATKHIHFFTIGTITCTTPSAPGGKAFDGGESKFNGKALTEMKNGKIKYIDGGGDIISPTGTNVLAVDFTGSEENNMFKWEGKVLGGVGAFKIGTKGTFAATGRFNRQQGTVDIGLVIHVTKI